MAFSVSDTGSIVEDFTNSLNEAFGGSGGKGDPSKFPRGVSGASPVGPTPASPGTFGAIQFNPERWTGNAYRPNTGRLKYGFAILSSAEAIGSEDISEDSTDTFFLQTAPQAIQQKEIFGTNVQATRKGVIVESEGVVFKDIIITGNTGVFPGERGGSNTPSPNTEDFGKPPQPPSGVDPDSGFSDRSGVTTVSGYQEFIALRQFFLTYAKKKVEEKGRVFFAWLNQKDNDFFVVEPLEFTMERDAKSPLTYNYRIVLKAIAKLDSAIKVQPSDSSVNALDSIANIAGNVSATIQSANEVINASTGLLTSVSQALDNTFLTPFAQFTEALNSINSGRSRVLSLPSTLVGNRENISQKQLAAKKALNGEGGSVQNNFATSQETPASEIEGDSETAESEVAVNELGEVTNTGPSTKKSKDPRTQDASSIGGKIPNLFNEDGTLNQNLTAEQFIEIREIIDNLNSDAEIPLPRSFVEALKQNTIKIRNNLADSIGAGSDDYNEILGRTVTQPAPPLATPTTDQFRVLGALQSVISGFDRVLANNKFFKTDAEGVYAEAQEKFGNVANINKPESVREVTVESGDTLERIALREYGDALRWVDLVVLNQLKAPYISNVENPPSGVKKPGETILVGDF